MLLRVRGIIGQQLLSRTKSNEGPYKLSIKKENWKVINQSTNISSKRRTREQSSAMYLNMRLLSTQKPFMHSIHKLTKLRPMLTKFNFRFSKSLNGLRMNLGGIFQSLLRLKKFFRSLCRHWKNRETSHYYRRCQRGGRNWFAPHNRGCCLCRCQVPSCATTNEET